MDYMHENFAAIAVMGELYDSGKDVYDVLAAYLKIVIQSENLKRFTSTEITERINKTNSFRVSESIVKTSLKRLSLNRDSGYYEVNDDISNVLDTSKLEEHTTQNKIVLDKLFVFISKDNNELLSAEEKSVIEEQFYKYICNPEYDGSYTLQISKFLMENSLDDNFHEALTRIKEGLLVYEGICFSPEFGNSGKWDIPLDIYLELEVLFYILGFNGDIHKEIYGQLIDYIDEINKSAPNGKKLINLFYTSEVKSEIESYFTTAENIFEKNEVVDPSKIAMINILDAVNSKHDIQIKKVNFYNSLTRKGIVEREIDFYSEENMKYNKISGDVYQYNCENINTERDSEYIQRCSDKINQINILRKDKNGSLKEAKSILLTANSTILKCAYMPFAFSNGDTPKAVNLDYLISRFWFKLGKGFGKGEAPKSVDIISRAQMIISSMTTAKVSKAYEDIKLKYKDGEINDDTVASILFELRKVQTNPEDITPERIDEQIAFLTDYDLNEKLENIKKEQLARIKDKDTIKELESKIDEINRDRFLEKQKGEEREKQFENQIAELKNINKETRDSNTEILEKYNSLVNKLLKTKFCFYKTLRVIIFCISVSLVALIIFLLCKFVIKIENSISGIISIVLSLFSLLLPPVKKLWRKYIKNYKFVSNN